MTKRLGLVLVLLAGLAISCATLSGGGSATSTEPGVLFQDDFSDTGSGWDRVSTEEGITDYADGVYRIYVNADNADYWANPGRNFTDVRVEVEATKVGGSDDNDMGIICRYQDTENFYHGLISSDGFVGIVKTQVGEQSVISGDGLEPSDAIAQGDVTNAIRLDCVGKTLTLYVNGIRTLEAQDSTWADGDVGLIAGTFDTPGTDVHFDDFVVREP